LNSGQTLKLALEHHQAGRLAEAQSLYRKVLQRDPRNADALHLLGLLEHKDGNGERGAELIERALRVQPANTLFLDSLAGTLQELQRFEAAETVLRRLVALRPGEAEAHKKLADVLHDLGRSEEAERSYRQALAARPAYAEACNNLGIVLRDLNRLEEAEAMYRQAIQLKPGFTDPYMNLGILHERAGRVEEAENAYRRVLEMDPDASIAHSCAIFMMDLLARNDVRVQQQERRQWYERHAKRYASELRDHDNNPDPARRLRIGYVSADFRRHAAAYVFGPLVRGHDRRDFEVICYSSVQREDEITAALRRAADGWRPVTWMSDAALAEQIRRDRIDILVDLSGHSAGNRLLVFARKPAPVQVTAWGHPTGTGLATIDCFFADPVALPAAQRGYFAEQIFDLPCILCYEPPAYLPAVPPLPALAAGRVTFGSTNRLEKITDEVLRHWGRILSAVPDARLLMKDAGLSDPAVRSWTLERLARAGIAAERVRLEGSSSEHVEHLKIFGQMDIGLNPFPKGGEISTAEALWMGVPVVTLPGETIPSRMAASIMTAIGMPEWIARSSDEYVDIAVACSRDLASLARVRENLRGQLARSAFGDMARYTAAVESAYRSLWQRWCDKKAAAA
jgi:predicted O-linked N-acetylglucosamine transferase (SPINDLY family)